MAVLFFFFICSYYRPLTEKQQTSKTTGLTEYVVFLIFHTLKTNLPIAHRDKSCINTEAKAIWNSSTLSTSISINSLGNIFSIMSNTPFEILKLTVRTRKWNTGQRKTKSMLLNGAISHLGHLACKLYSLISCLSFLQCICYTYIL